MSETIVFVLFAMNNKNYLTNFFYTNRQNGSHSLGGWYKSHTVSNVNKTKI